jgi:hypothetical protein
VSAPSDGLASGSLTDLRWRFPMESCQVRHRQLAQNRTPEIVNHARIGIAIFIASPSLGALCVFGWHSVRFAEDGSDICQQPDTMRAP